MDVARRSIIDRLRALPPYRLDALIALVVYVEICVELVLLAGLRGGELALGLLLAAGFGLGLALRRRRPILAVGLATSGLLTGNLMGPEVTDHVLTPFFTIIFVAYSAGAVLEGARLAAAFALGAAIVVAATLVDAYPDDVASFVFSITFAIGAPMLFGQLLRNRSRLNRALRDKARSAEHDRAERGRRRRAGGAHADRRRAARRRRPRPVGDDRAGQRVARRLADRDPAQARRRVRGASRAPGARR